MTLVKLLATILGLWVIFLTLLSWRHQSTHLVTQNTQLRKEIDVVRQELWQLERQIAVGIGQIDLDKIIKESGLKLVPIVPIEKEGD